MVFKRSDKITCGCCLLLGSENTQSQGAINDRKCKKRISILLKEYFGFGLVNACCCSLLPVDLKSPRNAGCIQVPTAEKLKKLVKKNTWNAGCTQLPSAYTS